MAAEIADAKEMIDTARGSPAIVALLAPVGYPDTELQAGLKLHAAAQEAFAGRQSSLGGKGEAKSAHDSTSDAARGEFADYRMTVQANFKPGAARVALGASGKMPGAQDKFITLARSAYTAAQQAPYADTLAKSGFTAARLQAALDAVEQLSQQTSAQDGAVGAAKGATDERNAAFAALQAWVGKFRQLARLALKRHPEHRAALKI